VARVARRAVVGVHELAGGPGQQRLGRVAEQALECGIDVLEVAVEPGDAEQVLRHVEDAVRVTLGVLPPALQIGERGHRVVHAGHELGPSARERADLGAMGEPVVLDGRVHAADLRGEPLGGRLQVAERRRDVPDLVATDVGDGGRLPGRRLSGRLGHLRERPRDRSPQHEAEAGDEEKHDKRRGDLAPYVRACRREIRRRRRRELAGRPKRRGDPRCARCGAAARG
jgi:hypothetical protein